MKKCIAVLFIGLLVASCCSTTCAPSVSGTTQKESGQAIKVGTPSSNFSHVGEIN